MMTKIKYSLCFLAGAIYTILWSMTISDFSMTIKTMILLVLLAISTILIVSAVLTFFVTNWRKK